MTTRSRALPTALLALLLAACGKQAPSPEAQTPAQLQPPVAATQPHEVIAPHGAARNDEYYWLRDDSRANPAMLEYLTAENAYADAVMAPHKALRDTLYGELTGRIKQDDSSVPYHDKDYWYYTRFEEGRDYPVYARKRGTLDAAEEVMLDVNAMADGKDYFQVGSWEVSPDQKLLAWTEDAVGRRQYVLRIKNLATGEVYSEQIAGLAEDIAWANDNRSVFYIENDPTTLLTTRVKRHALGSDPAGDPLVYAEADPSYYIGLMRTRSEQFICIVLSSTLTSEQRCTSAGTPGEFKPLLSRQPEVEYQADHLAGRWLIRSNWQAHNFRMAQASAATIGSPEKWTDVVPHNERVFIEDFSLFDDFIAIEERSEGLSRLRVLGETGENYVQADEPAYTMALSVNAEPGSEWLRYTYSSLATPTTTYELNVTSGERRLLKQEPVLGGFDKANYAVERLWAPARDGARIPVSVVYRKGFVRDGTAALLQYGYGSYGSSMDPRFNASVLSLLDRGMVYAIAHIRGGQEMGRSWYEDGKLLKKKNTFTDFIDATDYLIRNQYAAADRVAAMGGSAGGLLMGAIANMAPRKYRVIISLVPFVDVVTTMLDESIPLTTNEFDEWGNPADPTYYKYMLSYSPYDQIKRKDYPAMFVGTGLWDSQVQYFEPAKYVARLRARKTDVMPLLLRTNMQAGHGGKSGRLQRYHDTAEYQAFMLWQLGVK
ncbi:MAG: oligopeptidase B [Gammaproteobacteria bacterium HGW-Gammaproteobacteria-4]|jgi:oligopeptidase B|nr:MAG: oligopeptidase B [Gammaproteobacteria bacterium HGW-Gammaproteobacteria-4]